MSEPHEKRSARREPVHLVTAIELEGQETGCGVSRDASGGGFLLLTHLNVEPGRDLVLRVFVPHQEEPRRLAATVLRCERIPPTEGLVWDYRIAVTFRDAPPDFQDLVTSLIKR